MSAPCSPKPVIYDYRMSRPKRPEDPEKIMERRVFAVLVRTLRASLGWSQKDVAAQLGLSVAAVAKLELSLMRLTPDNHTALVTLFRETGIHFTYGPKSIAIALDEDVLTRLDPAEGLSLPPKKMKQRSTPE
jgi:transcriptional regulator with XRE-family HTH domain